MSVFSLPEMRSLPISSGMETVIEYCTRVHKAVPAGSELLGHGCITINTCSDFPVPWHSVLLGLHQLVDEGFIVFVSMIGCLLRIGDLV